tara:strand:- start:53 stop:310 length:258 start_codon:yes stop_codon:yes gene_type:complete
MALDADLVSILVCPESKVSVRAASTQEIEEMNELIKQDKVVSRGGEVLTTPVDMLLITVDGSRAFQVQNGIPNMILDDAIELVGT